MTIDPKFSTINAVEQLAEILKKECQKTIIVLGLDKENVLKAFQRSSIEDRVGLLGFSFKRMYSQIIEDKQYSF